jgi:5-oxoprolinase (ATP-hydrolysing) subunit A
MNVVDLNSDMGESFGLYNYGADEEIIRFISSSNIACGFHAGDPSIIRKSVRLACKHGVAIGAHFGFPDLLGFGRRNLQVEPTELKDYLTYQLGALQAFVTAEGVQLHHVKPHGALYMMALECEEMSQSIVEAVLQHNSNLALYTMEGSATFYIAKKLGLKTVSEVFADRGYRSDGTVKMFHWNIAEAGGTPQAIGDRIARLFTTGKIASIDGREIEVRAETVCIHSDTPGAPEIARAIRSALERAGINVKAP